MDLLPWPSYWLPHPWCENTVSHHGVNVAASLKIKCHFILSNKKKRSNAFKSFSGPKFISMMRWLERSYLKFDTIIIIKERRKGSTIMNVYYAVMLLGNP
jgi:hypothetical protein